ncbi:MULTISPECIES: cation transporter [unclassified Limnobacter]|uniref:cation transporter n=1 Tax=unclassified Limnobacter TaxID=2630203 RepID=UPI000DB08093|nr:MULTISPECIES: cation diffusion facilitator family transporter [unclassified Limnobacter]PZO19254.1 MAG: cation transporter [Betaproteobacteria bacterium]PZO25058.1 MAG: cation transporter [Betaproteobacteria bacterium]PZO32160.1 MAG: cation transporter [Betaproteobacteria bacterium]VWX37300.1 Cation transporter [Limnobacter sp. 130]
MPGCSTCHDHQPAQSVSPTYKKVLWVALVVNLGMFIVEVASGLKAGSVSLLADSLDFFGDAANYAVSLFVLGMALSIRAKAALVKGATLGIFGVGVLAYTAYRLWTGQVPEPLTMGVVAVLALVANVAVALMLYKWREGDSNMQSVWLCSRNDAIGNVAVVAAAGLVAWTGSAWPDLAVAVLMATLGITAARTIITQAWRELNQTSV